MSLHASVPPEIVAIATPVAAEKTTEVDSVNFRSDGLVVAMSSENWEAQVCFPQSYGFRVLDELDLTEFWSQCSLVDGWVFEVLKGGWKALEMTREHFYSGRQDWVREYLIVGVDACVSVLSKETPVFNVRATSKPSSHPKADDSAQVKG